MPVTLTETTRQLSGWLGQLVQGLILLAAFALLTASVAAGFGLLPWPDLALSYGGRTVPEAGKWAQLALAALMLALVFYLPAHQRVARLERSHRSFATGMEDVTRAYRIAHAADRSGVFALSSEFEAMRARFDHLRQHPDLAALEPELLHLAAEMSFVARDLARTYSDEKVACARIFLQQRQHEAHDLTDRLGAAHRTCDELRRWLADIEAVERANNQQIRRLEADLKEILPTLGYDFDLEDIAPANVVSLAKPGK